MFLEFKLKARVGVMMATLFFLQSCLLPDGGRGDHPAIDDWSRDQYDSSRFCREFTTVQAIGEANEELCLSRCPAGTVPGSKQQIEKLLEDIELSENSDEIKEMLSSMVKDAKGVCFPEIIERPKESIFVQRNYCACLNALPDVINDCVLFCSDQDEAAQSTLYGEVRVGPEVELNPLLGNLHNWCEVELNEFESAPSCVLDVWSDSGPEIQLGVSTFPNSNRFESNISELRYDRTYVARIVEVSSGASSDAFQIRRFRFDDGNNDADNPLKITPISQYTCLDRSVPGCGEIDDQTNAEFYNCARRRYYYFQVASEPPAVNYETNFIVCHDLALGQDDNELFPRFELRPHHMGLWDQTDFRFYDLNGDGKADINQTIRQRLLDEYGENREQVNVFALFSWPNAPPRDQGSNNNRVNQGFIMQPWINSQTGRAFCPGISEYNGNDNMFRILGELVGVETEAVYLAVQEHETALADQVDTLMLIRENKLRQIWFYIQNGQHIEPTNVTAGQRTIRFYWPPDPENPFQRKAYQRMFTIRHPTELAQNTGIPTNIVPPDKRIGCIPRID